MENVTSKFPFVATRTNKLADWLKSQNYKMPNLKIEVLEEDENSYIILLNGEVFASGIYDEEVESLVTDALEYVETYSKAVNNCDDFNIYK